jgi:hypothetical protein
MVSGKKKTVNFSCDIEIHVVNLTIKAVVSMFGNVMKSYTSPFSQSFSAGLDKLVI